ncbi:hypothetical protein D3C71_1959380 [compost metagenome]
MVYDALRRAGDWIKRNPGPAAAWHAPLIGLDPATVEAANLRRTYQVQAVDAASLEEQQRIADAFAAQSILPRKVTVAASPVWKPV